MKKNPQKRKEENKMSFEAVGLTISGICFVILLVAVLFSWK
jgi:hypothetical protein